MKNVILIGVISFFLAIAYGQDNVIVFKNNKLYEGKGVIFKATYSMEAIIPSVFSRFTPTITDIECAEHIFFEQTNEVLGKYSDYYKGIKNVQKKFARYNRQYFGYCDVNGDRIVFIQLLNFSCKILNFSCKKEIKENFENWENELIIGFGEFYEKNTFRVKINLTTQMLDVF